MRTRSFLSFPLAFGLFSTSFATAQPVDEGEAPPALPASPSEQAVGGQKQSAPVSSAPVPLGGVSVPLGGVSVPLGGVSVPLGGEVGFDELLNRPGGLTSDEAARQAAAYSLDAVIAQEQYKSADAQKKEVVYNYAPKVTLSASYTRQMVPQVQDTFGGANLVGTTEPAGALAPGAPLFAIDGSAFSFNQLPNQYYMNAGVTVPISDYVFNLSQALSGANAAKRSAEQSEKAARVAAGANARLYYYDWVRVRLRREEALKAISRAEMQLKDLRGLHAGGRVVRSDVLRQEAFLSRMQFELNRANVQELVARQQLHQAMTGGRGEVPAWEVGESIMSGKDGQVPRLTDLDRLQQEAIEKRLEIEALKNTAYALEQKSSVERSQGLPRVEAFGNLTYANPNQIYFPPLQEWNGSWNAGIRLNWTVNDLGARRAAAAATDAESAKIRVQKQQLEDALRTEVLTTTQTLVQANLALDSAHHGLSAAQAAHDDRSQLVQHGRGTILDLVDSETALITARLDVIDAYIALKAARVSFEHAVGRDIDSTLTADTKSTK